MTSEPRVIELEEYLPATLPQSEISEEVGEYIFREYGDKVSVETPSFKTEGRWKLTPKGWVGYLPVNKDLGISLKPRVELANLFRMLEYAYNLRSFRFLEGLTSASTLQDLYERLANVLAKRVLTRARKGFFRAYVQERDRLPYLRGSLDLRDRLRRPWSPQLTCSYEENTSDVEENQILAWTLMRTARSGACSERVLPTVRRAYRSVRSFATLRPFAPEACANRLYNRLNDDYEPLHSLCRFFLENTGPTHEAGDRRMLPFVVNMPRLFELFVAQWLKTHHPPHIAVQAQERTAVGASGDFHFDIDIVISDADSQVPLAVLDTKYKKPDKHPEPADVAQVVTCAELKGCPDAFLVYPEPMTPTFDCRVGAIRVRSVVFPLAEDPEKAGAQFLASILEI